MSRSAEPSRHRAAPAQRALWLIQRAAPESPAYNVAFGETLRGPLHPDALRAALEDIVGRHAPLRSHLVEEGGELWVEADPEWTLPLRLVDHGDPATELERLARTPIALDRGAPFSVVLVRITRREHVLGFAFHHAVFDGGSIDVLLTELGLAYAARVRGEAPQLPELTANYGSFAERITAISEDEGLLEGWVEGLRGAPDALSLPTDRPRPPLPSGRGATLRASWPPSASVRIREFAAEHRATPFVVLVAGLAALLHRLCGQDEVVIGTPITLRQRRSSQALIGMFLNTVALRVDLTETPTFGELVTRARKTFLDALRHPQAPFDRLVERLAPPRVPGRHPIFQVMLTLQPAKVVLELPGLETEYFDLEAGAAKFDLSVSALDNAEGLHLTFEYDADLFEGASVDALGEALRMLLVTGIERPEMPLRSLPLVDPSARPSQPERGPLRPEAPRHLVPLAFAKWVAKRPDHPAVTDANATVSYAELHHHARQIASSIQAQGIGRGDRIAVIMPRQTSLVAALLATHLAAAAYVPIDPALPSARMTMMLEDADVGLIMSTTAVRERLEGLAPTRPWLLVDAISTDAPTVEASPLDPDDLAYVIYTSGSTGQPKGVALTHANLANLVHAIADEPGLAVAARWLAVTTISFDIAALELFGPLSAGAEVVLADSEQARDPQWLAMALDRDRIDIMQATPSTWALLQRGGWRGRSELVALSGGEALPRDLARALVPKVAALFNLYGPTETTIWSCIERVDDPCLASPAARTHIPIGHPLANATVMVVDDQGQPLPIGFEGELWLGGSGVALGYWRRPELTAERFVKVDADTGPARVYRTGDRVRRRFDGRLEFLGRSDHQLKLRGFRIEAGEIEANLVRHGAIDEALVSTRPGPGGEPRLIAWVRPAGAGAVPNAAELQAHLARMLPDYMIPSAYVAVQTWPSNSAGKIDRRRLPDPGWQPPTSAATVAPRDEFERVLASLWEDLLERRGVGIDERFFALGGHSMLALRLTARIDETFGRQLPVQAVFRYQTIREQAELLRNEGAEITWRALEVAKPSGSRPPFFFVGSAAHMYELAGTLGPELPIYGLNVFGLLPADGQPFSMTIEEVAAAFLDELRTIQPRGPYHLGGYCEEAKVALEMARQLQRAGERVALLAYFDVIWIPISRRMRVEHWARSLYRYGPAYLLRHIEGLRDNIVERAEHLVSRVRARVQALWGQQPSLHDRDIALMWGFYDALWRQPTPPHEGDLEIFISEEFLTPSTPRRLATLARGGVNLVPISGYHTAMFETPNIEVLARALEAAVDRASPVEG